MNWRQKKYFFFFFKVAGNLIELQKSSFIQLNKGTMFGLQVE